MYNLFVSKLHADVIFTDPVDLIYRITFGFMAVTGFLSMWLPNIPTTAMMIPIAAAVLKELDAHRKNMRQIKRNGSHGMCLSPAVN